MARKVAVNMIFLKDEKEIEEDVVERLGVSLQKYYADALLSAIFGKD